MIIGGNMNYYDEIKQELINNEIIKQVKDYSKNKSDLTTYYKVGKLLSEAGKCYGENIIKEYSIKLTNEIGKGYGITNLKRMRQFYQMIEKGAAVQHLLSWTHIKQLLPLKNIDEINYYIQLSEQHNLSYRQLREKIRNKEYERLDVRTKEILIEHTPTQIYNFIKNPIVIKNSQYHQEISEKLLKKLILEDIDNFLIELGDGFSYIQSEYKIKLGDRYNYIDLLLYNYQYNCFVVVELKITELKAEHIGQIQKYMHYIDKNIKQPYQDKTIGIIIVKKDNQYIMEYCSDERIYHTTYTFI